MTEDTCTEDTACGLAKKEFKVIRDLLLVPLKPDSPNEELPKHRKWKGGCIPVGLPDLVPFNPPGVERFCNLIDVEEGNTKKRKLVVTVKNQGNATAPPSITKVIFFPTADEPNGVTADIPTEEIPAGKSIDLVVDKTPVQCSSESDCQFVIIVNADSKVVESNFTNNVAIGLCGSTIL